MNFISDENEFDFESRILSTAELGEDGEKEASLRPQTLEDYVGQSKVKENLKKQFQV